MAAKTPSLMRRRHLISSFRLSTSLWRLFTFVGTMDNLVAAQQMSRNDISHQIVRRWGGLRYRGTSCRCSRSGCMWADI
eukprot:1275827-Rhodomonas_salina.1